MGITISEEDLKAIENKEVVHRITDRKISVRVAGYLMLFTKGGKNAKTVEIVITNRRVKKKLLIPFPTSEKMHELFEELNYTQARKILYMALGKCQV